MADPHHTARARLSEPFWLVNEPQLPLSPELARQHARVLSVAGTSFAIHVIRHLLKRSKRSYRARLADKPLQTDPWPRKRHPTSRGHEVAAMISPQASAAIGLQVAREC